MTDETCDALETAYDRLQTGDPLAQATLAEVLLDATPRLIATVRQRVNIHGSAAEDALMDLTMKLIAGTASFDPKRGRLFSWLVMELKNDVMNDARGERRRAERQAKSVWLKKAVADPPSAGEGAGNAIEQEEWERMQVDKAAKLLGEEDQRFLRAVYDGADDMTLVQILGAAELDEAAQRHAIRRAIDRIRKRLQRGGAIE